MTPTDTDCATINDAVQDGPVLAIHRNRGILDLVIAPDGDFGDDLDVRGISIDLDDLNEALGKLGLRMIGQAQLKRDGHVHVHTIRGGKPVCVYCGEEMEL
jgi:hypothetical protein